MGVVLKALFSEGVGSYVANEQGGAGQLVGSPLPSWDTGVTPSGDGKLLDYPGNEGGGAVVFNGGPSPDGTITIGVWVKSTQTFSAVASKPERHTIIARRGGHLTLDWEQDTVDGIVWVRCALRDTTDTIKTIQARDDGQWRDGEWHHILVRFQPSTAPMANDGLLNMWVDGVEVKNEDGHDQQDLKVSGLGDWWAIGARKTSSGDLDRNLSMRMDEITIWNTYESDSTIEAEADYQGESPMAKRPYFKFLREGGDADLSQDYTTPDTAEFVATEDVYVSKIIMYRRDNAASEAQDFGDAGNLSNGLGIEHRSAADATILDFLDGEPIEADGDLFKFGFVDHAIDPTRYQGTSSHFVSQSVMDLEVGGEQPYSRGRKGYFVASGEKIVAVLQDDLSDINEFTIGVWVLPAS